MRSSAHDEVDCVVIGTGAGGAPLLARLAMAGLRVVALEAGPRRALDEAALLLRLELPLCPLWWREKVLFHQDLSAPCLACWQKAMESLLPHRC